MGVLDGEEGGVASGLLDKLDRDGCELSCEEWLEAELELRFRKDAGLLSLVT